MNIFKKCLATAIVCTGLVPVAGHAASQEGTRIQVSGGIIDTWC